MRAVRLEPALATPDPPLRRPGHVGAVQRHRRDREGESGGHRDHVRLAHL
jgi:hypothetical protein